MYWRKSDTEDGGDVEGEETGEMQAEEEGEEEGEGWREYM